MSLLLKTFSLILGTKPSLFINTSVSTFAQKQLLIIPSCRLFATKSTATKKSKTIKIKSEPETIKPKKSINKRIRSVHIDPTIGEEMKYYAVQVGREPGIYTSWDDCQKQVNKFSGAIFKSFDTEQEARTFIATVQRPKRKRSKDSDSSGEESKIPGLAHSSKKKKIDPLEERIIVYTDGSCLANGHSGAIGGIGVYFGENDPRNLSEPLDLLENTKRDATNQRAEIMAAIRALEQAKDSLSKAIEIRTDSSYTVMAMTEWIQNWKTKKDFREDNSSSKILNRDLFVRLDELIKQRTGAVYFVHVAGHAGEFGNEQANILAVAASNISKFGKVGTKVIDTNSNKENVKESKKE